MGNEIKVDVTGDSKTLEKAFDNATKSSKDLEAGVTKSGFDMEASFSKSMRGASLLNNGLMGLGDSIDAVTSLSRAGAERADRYARAQNDVAQSAVDLEQAVRDAAQATLDLDQAQRDTAQSALDVEQAQLDAEVAQKAYTDAVKEHGAKSVEARQATIDLKQANEDLSQAQQDAKQAAEDQNQALVDQHQATVNAKGAQLDLNEAQRGVPSSQGALSWVSTLTSLAPAVMTVVGVMDLFKASTLAGSVATGVATAAQWAWNIALDANPIGIVIIAIVALVGVFVLLWNKCDWFRNFWIGLWHIIQNAAKAVADWFTGTLVPFFSHAWDRVKAGGESFMDAVKSIPGRLKSLFDGIVNIITWPFRTAFNAVSDAWNATIGRLSWTIPEWVPKYGGNTISAPHLPHFHQGGTVPGQSGQEVLAILRAGERVSPEGTPAGGSGATISYGNIYVTVTLDELRAMQDQVSDVEELLEWFDSMRNRGRRGVALMPV